MNDHPTAFFGVLGSVLFTALFAAAPVQASDGSDPSPHVPVALTSQTSDAVAHVVEPRPHTEAKRHELIAYPLDIQINSAWSRHIGVSLGYAWHLTERFALKASPFFNYVSGESAFQRELIDKASVQADAATALLLRWGATGGVELTPFDGKFAFADSLLGRFSISIELGIGGASTRVQLSDDGFGSSGGRFIGMVGISAKVTLSDHLFLRLELRDTFTTARVTTISGCSRGDFEALERGEGVGKNCRADNLSDVEKNNARLLLDSTSSSILNQLSVRLGVGFLF